MKLTKLKKLLLATTITTLTLSAVAYAAPVVYKNLKVHYNVNLVVNGAQYVGATEATKPFITDGGRTYVSIASLVESKIAQASFDASTSTVTVTGATANQDQITALSNQILSLENQNAVLKAENDTLKKNTSTSKPDKDTGDLALKTITKSSDRTDFQRDIEKELRGIKANVYSFGSQSFDDSAEVKISHTSNKVTVTLKDSKVFGKKSASTSTTSTRADDWNKAWDKYDDDMEEDYETFIEEEVMDVVRDILSDYSEYDIDVTIVGYEKSDNTGEEYELVNCKYSDSKDTLRTNVYDI